jgi:hypothetical protein
MFSEVDLQINDIKKSKLSPIFNFGAKKEPLNEIQNTIYNIFSETTHQELSESV